MVVLLAHYEDGILGKLGQNKTEGGETQRRPNQQSSRNRKETTAFQRETVNKGKNWNRG